MREATAGARVALGRKLVVADDSTDFRRLVRTAVGPAYDGVIEVADGRQLLWGLLRAWWSRQAPAPCDLVVLADVRMPVYSGLDVLEALKDLDWRLPFVVTTAYPDDFVRARVARLGGGLLFKPFTLAELRRVLAQVTAWR